MPSKPDGVKQHLKKSVTGSRNLTAFIISFLKNTLKAVSWLALQMIRVLFPKRTMAGGRMKRRDLGISMYQHGKN
jgi:hypothetical protein